MTSVPPTQPPAAPENDVRLTALFDRAHDEVIRLCQPGESWRMSIPANPDRDSDLILSDALTKAAELAERVRVVEGERDAARAGALEKWEYVCEIAQAVGIDPDDVHPMDAVDRLTARAESAEAAHEALRKGIEALTWRPAVLDTVSGKTYPPRRRVHVRVRDIDALLTGGAS